MILKGIKPWVTLPPSSIGGAFWVPVKITTDDGIGGIGECYGIPVSGDIACTRSRIPLSVTLPVKIRITL